MAPRCRVLLLDPLDPEHPRSGGAQVHIHETFSRLASHGVHVTWLASSFAGSVPKKRVGNFELRRLGPLGVYFPRAAWTVARQTRRHGFDVVVECLNKVPFYSPLYSSVPVLAVCHHLFGGVAFLQVRWPVAAAVWTSERGIPRAYRRTPFVAISQSCRGDLIRRGVPAGNIQVIHCGVSRPAVDVDPGRARPQRVAYLGRLEPYKRVDVFLRAMAVVARELPGVEVLVIGEGSHRKRLEALASELGVAGRTRFTGFVPHEERDRLLAGAGVAVCPSVKEGWGLVVLEANAVGTPVVATDAPGLRDSVLDGETGVLVPRDDVCAFAAAVVRILSDDGLARRMRRQALAWAARFSWQATAESMAEALTQARRMSRPAPDGLSPPEDDPARDPDTVQNDFDPSREPPP